MLIRQRSWLVLIIPLNQLIEANFPVVCAIRVLGLTLLNALPVAFGCSNAVQTSRVLYNLTLILNVRNVEVKHPMRPFQTSSQLLSIAKKSKKSVVFAILVISLDNVVGVSMPQQPQ